MAMKKLILPVFLSFSLLGVITPSYAFTCTEYKIFVSNKTGKEAAKDVPSWVSKLDINLVKIQMKAEINLLNVF